MPNKLKTYHGMIGGQFHAKVAATSMTAAAEALTAATGMKFTLHEIKHYWGRGEDCPEAIAMPGRVFVNRNGGNYPIVWGTYEEARAAIKARRAMMAKE